MPRSWWMVVLGVLAFIAAIAGLYYFFTTAQARPSPHARARAHTHTHTHTNGSESMRRSAPSARPSTHPLPTRARAPA